MCKNKSAPRLVKSDALLKNNGMVLHPNDLESQGHLERIVCPNLWGSAAFHETRVGCFVQNSVPQRPRECSGRLPLAGRLPKCID
jgi:hypothetical protein